MLLEDAICEAAPKYLRVFGPDAPDKGYFFAGQFPAAHFIKQEVKDANFKNVPLDQYVAKFVRLGYTFVFSDGKNISVQTQQENLKFGSEAIHAMENSIGLKPDSQVTWNGQTQPAAHVFYGQPEHAAPKSTATKQPASQLQLGQFGGVAGPGQVRNVDFVNHRELQRGLNNGYGFILRYGNGSVAVITPQNFRFSYDAIENIEKWFGMTPQKKVKWYQGQLTDGEDVDANVAIYGGKA